MTTTYNPSRVGRFVIDVNSMERDPEVVRAVMGRCIVVRCERLHAKDIFEYIAVSPEFDEVLPGETTPDYDLVISERGKNVKFIRFPPTDAIRIEALEKQVASNYKTATDYATIADAYAEENAKLRAFAQDVMGYWPGSDIDNDLEKIAVLHGLLKPELRNTPCTESCYCAKNVNENEWVEGVVCYRKTTYERPTACQQSAEDD